MGGAQLLTIASNSRILRPSYNAETTLFIETVKSFYSHTFVYRKLMEVICKESFLSMAWPSYNWLHPFVIIEV